MRTRLYADDRCIVEVDSIDVTQNGTYSPSQKDGYSSVVINTDQEIKKKPHNCPNCGAPLTSDICEYCGTEFEKPKKKLSDEEMRESFAEFARKQRQAELQASQEWQTQNLLNSLNSYNVNTQIMNMRDSINASMLTNVYPTGRIEHIPIGKDDDIEKEADALAHGINVLCVSLVLFLILVLVIVAYYFLK